MKERVREAVILCMGIVALCVFLYVSGIGCPIRFIMGYPCPTCGMTRAWWSVFHLDFARAFAYHPLYYLVPVIGLILLFRDKLPKRIVTLSLIAIGIAFMAVYLYKIT